MAARCRFYLNIKQLEDLEKHGLSLWWHHGMACPYWAVEPKEAGDKLTATPEALAAEILERPFTPDIVIERFKKPVITYRTSRAKHLYIEKVREIQREEVEFLFVLYEPER